MGPNYLKILVLAILAISCENQADTLTEPDAFGKNMPIEHSNLPSDRVANSLEVITDEEGVTNYIESSTQREDVVFKANRLSNAYYLGQKAETNQPIDEVLKTVEQEQLFYFEFSETQKVDLLKKYFDTDYEEAIKYLSFTIANDFKLVINSSDTIDALYTTYERNFHVAPFERLLLGFVGVSASDEVKLIYSDKLFKKGQLEFVFPPLEQTITLTKEIL